jgi:hypothetical protein
MSGAVLVLSVVDSRTGEAHRVPIETAALHRRSGRYPALCGAEVVTASLATAPSRLCPMCRFRTQGGGEAAMGKRRFVSKGRSPWHRWFIHRLHEKDGGKDV